MREEQISAMNEKITDSADSLSEKRANLGYDGKIHSADSLNMTGATHSYGWKIYELNWFIGYDRSHSQLWLEWFANSTDSLKKRQANLDLDWMIHWLTDSFQECGSGLSHMTYTISKHRQINIKPKPMVKHCLILMKWIVSRCENVVIWLQCICEAWLSMVSVYFFLLIVMYMQSWILFLSSSIGKGLTR